MFPGEGKTGFLRRGAGRYAHDDRLDHRRYADNLCCIYSASDVKWYVWTALYTARVHDHFLYDGFLILSSHHRAALLYVLASGGEGSCAGRTYNQRHPGLVSQAYAACHQALCACIRNDCSAGCPVHPHGVQTEPGADVFDR